MSKIKTNIGIVITVAAIIIAAVWFLPSAIKLFQSPIRYTVVSGVVEDTMAFSGYALKAEQLYTADAAGFFQSRRQEGERVAVGESLGVLYKGSAGADVIDKLNLLNQKIAGLQTRQTSLISISSNDPNKIDAQISEKMADLVVAAQNKNIYHASEVKADIEAMLDRRAAAGGAAQAQQSGVASLLKQRQDIEKTAKLDKTDIVAKSAGLFSIKIDGLESQLSFNKADKLTPEMLDEIDKLKPSQKSGVVSGAVVAKVVDNYDWKLVFNVEKISVDNLVVGNTITIRIDEDALSEVAAVVERISQPVGSRVLVVVSGTKDEKQILSKRKINGEVIKRRYEGFKIPSSAIKINGSVTGVFVVSENVVKFTPVEVLHNSGKFVIIKESAAQEKGVRLYDQILTKVDEVQDGTVIK